MPAPLSSTTPGEAWVWGDYVLVLQTHPKTVLDIMNEMTGKPAECMTDLDYPFAVTVYYRKDRNPHGPSSQPILVVGLERMDYAKVAAMMGMDSSDLDGIPSGLGPPVLGVFTASSHLNKGGYNGSMDADSVRHRLFSVIADHVHPVGDPVRIGPISAIHGHPDTGWPALKKKSGCMSAVVALLLLATCCSWMLSGQKPQPLQSTPPPAGMPPIHPG